MKKCLIDFLEFCLVVSLFVKRNGIQWYRLRALSSSARVLVGSMCTIE